MLLRKFISVLIYIIDDTLTKNSGKKREYILNWEYKYIKINKKNEKNFVLILLFQSE